MVLAGGPSHRLGHPKALASFRGRPLIAHVLAAAREVATEVVVVSRGRLAADIGAVVPDVRVVLDTLRVRSPLVGLLAGARALRSPYVAALACDLPLYRPRVLRQMFAFARGHDAAIPRWPDGRIEPLAAVYGRSALLAATRRSLAAGQRSNHDMIGHLPHIRYVSTETLRRVDPRLRSFTNVNTPEDLARAARM